MEVAQRMIYERERRESERMTERERKEGEREREC